MASLKDLRNRIASVKATRKITKAMQMVAAAKLRRAQEAAVAARPYSERMAVVLANLASAMEGKAGAPKLLAGTGNDQVHLLSAVSAVVSTPPSPSWPANMPTVCCATARPSRS
jgi:F-type H+-transporting ATPase subunit gamma